jgi:hypothetical protein
MATEDETTTEVSVHTEPSLSEVLGRDGPAKADPETLHAYRQWWKKNPRNNPWPTKPSLWPRFQKEVLEGMTPEEASKSGANVLLEDLET